MEEALTPNVDSLRPLIKGAVAIVLQELVAAPIEARGILGRIENHLIHVRGEVHQIGQDIAESDSAASAVIVTMAAYLAELLDLIDEAMVDPAVRVKATQGRTLLEAVAGAHPQNDNGGGDNDAG